MIECPECGSEMTHWMTQLLGSNTRKQIRLCKNEKGRTCRFKEYRTTPKKIRDKIKRRWRKDIETL